MGSTSSDFAAPAAVLVPRLEGEIDERFARLFAAQHGGDDSGALLADDRTARGLLDECVAAMAVRLWETGNAHVLDALDSAVAQWWRRRADHRYQEGLWLLRLEPYLTTRRADVLSATGVDPFELCRPRLELDALAAPDQGGSTYATVDIPTDAAMRPSRERYTEADEIFRSARDAGHVDPTAAAHPMLVMRIAGTPGYPDHILQIGLVRDALARFAHSRAFDVKAESPVRVRLSDGAFSLAPRADAPWPTGVVEGADGELVVTLSPHALHQGPSDHAQTSILAAKLELVEPILVTCVVWLPYCADASVEHILLGGAGASRFHALLSRPNGRLVLVVGPQAQNRLPALRGAIVRLDERYGSGKVVLFASRIRGIASVHRKTIWGLASVDGAPFFVVIDGSDNFTGQGGALVAFKPQAPTHAPVISDEAALLVVSPLRSAWAEAYLAREDLAFSHGMKQGRFFVPPPGMLDVDVKATVAGQEYRRMRRGSESSGFRRLHAFSKSRQLLNKALSSL